MRRVLSLIAFFVAAPVLAVDKPISLFDGKTFAGWEGDTEKTWRIEDGAVVGGSLDEVVARNEFLCTKQSFGDFELRVKCKLVGGRAKANGGVQVRSRRVANRGDGVGLQAE